MTDEEFAAAWAAIHDTMPEVDRGRAEPGGVRVGDGALSRGVTRGPLADSNVIAFDRTSEQLLPIATIIRETSPEHQTALIGHIVERVTITDGEVTDIGLRSEARPFYAGLVMAPPDGRGALTAKPEEKLAAYL